MFTQSITRAAVLSMAVATAASAQSTAADSSDHQPSELARRSATSLTFVQSRPQGTFGRNVGLGYGIDGAYVLRLDDAGIWSIRANVGIVAYGNESRRTPLSESIGGRVRVDVETTNYLAPMSTVRSSPGPAAGSGRT